MPRKRYKSYPSRRKRRYYRKSSPPIPVLIAIILALGILTRFGRDRLSGLDLSASMPYIIAGTVIFGLCILAAIWLPEYRRRQRWRQVRLSGVDKLSGFDFERYCLWLLREMGYKKVKLTQEGADFGADITCYANGSKYAVQVKRYNGKVGIEAVYQVLGGKDTYNAQKAMVMTNSFFTPAAKQQAKNSGCYLVDRTELGEWVEQVKSNS